MERTLISFYKYSPNAFLPTIVLEIIGVWSINTKKSAYINDQPHLQDHFRTAKLDCSQSFIKSFDYNQILLNNRLTLIYKYTIIPKLVTLRRSLPLESHGRSLYICEIHITKSIYSCKIPKKILIV